MHDEEFYTELGFSNGTDGWEAYCLEKRGIALRYAYYHIEAFDICTMVQSRSLPPPRTERHARELYPLRDDER